MGHLCHGFVPQKRRVLLIRAGDVILQPIFQKMQDLDRNDSLTGLVIRLKCQHLPGQRLVLRPVRGQIGIIVQSHEAFFMGEVDGGVLHQAVQNSRECGFTLTRGHGGVELRGSPE